MTIATPEAPTCAPPQSDGAPTIAARLDALDWAAAQRRPRRSGVGPRARSLSHAKPIRFRRSMRGRRASVASDHGPTRLRARRIPLFQLSAAPLIQSLRAAAYLTWRRSPIAGASGWARRRAFPWSMRRFSSAATRRASFAPPAPAGVRGRGLQLLAPRPLRRARVSAADRHPPRSARRRLRWRRVRDDGAAAADADPAHGAAAPQGRRGDLRRQQPANEGRASDIKVRLNHGVSKLRSGNRHTLGVIFHDAA